MHGETRYPFPSAIGGGKWENGDTRRQQSPSIAQCPMDGRGYTSVQRQWQACVLATTHVSKERERLVGLHVVSSLSKLGWDRCVGLPSQPHTQHGGMQEVCWRGRHGAVSGPRPQRPTSRWTVPATHRRSDETLRPRGCAARRPTGTGPTTVDRKLTKSSTKSKSKKSHQVRGGFWFYTPPFAC